MELDVDAYARTDYQTVCARSAEIGLRHVDAALDGDISADAAGGACPRVRVDLQEGIRAELNASAISPSPPSKNYKRFLSHRAAITRSSRIILQH